MNDAALPFCLGIEHPQRLHQPQAGIGGDDLSTQEEGEETIICAAAQNVLARGKSSRKKITRWNRWQACSHYNDRRSGTGGNDISTAGSAA
jgi:hypothetical protein